MKFLPIVFFGLLIFTSCGEKKNETEQDVSRTPMSNRSMPSSVQKSNISIDDAALIILDPKIKSYSEELNEANKKYNSGKTLKSKSALIDAYIKYADYMQYESTVSPMKGKYRKALSLYRKALELDSGNSRVMAEITQIEGIYKSMGRPIPND